MTTPTFGDRVQETTTTTGTGTYSLGGAVTGYQAFSAIVANNGTCYYMATDGTNWETGLGTYATSGNQLARTTILESSNGNSAVSWAAGTKSISLIFPATAAAAAAGGLTVGTSAIASGTGGYILYNNGGVLGNVATTGSGNVVLSTSPTLVTPALGTPASGNLSNCTGIPSGTMTALGVGSIISAKYSGGGTPTAGTSKTSGNLQVVSCTGNATSDLITGTWQCLTSIPSGTDVCLWQRVS